MSLYVTQFPNRFSKVRSQFHFDENVMTSEALQELCLNTRVVLIADSAVASRYGEKLKKFLGAELIKIKGGEGCKTRKMKQYLEDVLLKKKYGRDTTIIGLGGGTVTDLVGFLATSYMRGVPLILIPTTLLAMVDAAVGGKNGINTPIGKNMLGSIYHPKGVFLDTQFLDSLPQQEWQNGVAEIMKLGLVADEAIWEKCEQEPPPWQDPQQLKRLIYSAVGGKLHILDEDIEANGMRHILNFGHTVGHALELLSDYEMSHGQAVAVGCLAESFLSCHLGHLDEGDLKKITHLYKKRGFTPTLPCSFTKEKFKEAISMDKKALKGQPRFVILEKIGQCNPFEGRYCQIIDEKSLDALIEWLKNR